MKPPLTHMSTVHNPNPRAVIEVPDPEPDWSVATSIARSANDAGHDGPSMMGGQTPPGTGLQFACVVVHKRFQTKRSRTLSNQLTVQIHAHNDGLRLTVFPTEKRPRLSSSDYRSPAAKNNLESGPPRVQHPNPLFFPRSILGLSCLVFSHDG